MDEATLAQVGPALLLAGAIGALVGVVAIAWVANKVFDRAASTPPAMTVVLLLAFLTALAIVGYIIVRRTELITLAATGIGALAGAVTALYVSEREHRE